MDRRDVAFGEPPGRRDPVPHRVAWDMYALGRLDRMGYPAQRQRRLYNYRNRHGFTDVGDAAFDKSLWNGEGLTWADIRTALRRRPSGGGTQLSRARPTAGPDRLKPGRGR